MFAPTTNTPAIAPVASQATRMRLERLSAQIASRDGMKGRPNFSNGRTISRSIEPNSTARRSHSDDEQRDERAGEGAGDEPDRAAVEVHDEDDAEHDRDGDVDERDGQEALRSLLEAVEPRRGLVEQRDQHPGAGHEPEALVVVAEEERRSDRASRARR